MAALPALSRLSSDAHRASGRSGSLSTPGVRSLLRLRGRSLLLIAVAAACLLLAGASSAYGQLTLSDAGTESIRAAAPEDRVRTSIRQAAAGDTATAASLLRSVVDDRPGFVSPQHGAAAYWLGRLYEQQNRDDLARKTWSTGVEAMLDGKRFDPRLADAYLQTLTPASLRQQRLKAVRVYTTLLGDVHPGASSPERNIYRRYVAQIEPLFSDDDLARIIEQKRKAPAEDWTFQDGAGDFLASWWRSLDPMPATDENERLEEHLTRLQYARAEYRCSDRVSGLDDRGLVYLRFGEPAEEHSITYTDGNFRDEVFRFGVAVNSRDFPKNEFWIYRDIDQAGHYIFARKRNCYELGGAVDLIPDHLKQYRGSSERALNIAYSSMMAMRYVYRELAIRHVDYSAVFGRIDSYANYQEMQAMGQRAREATGGGVSSGSDKSVEVGAGFGQSRTVFANPSMGIEGPSDFVSQMVTRAEHLDHATANRREDAMPRQHTDLLDDVGSLPVAVRTARFLNDDGSTRVDVYWGVQTPYLFTDNGPASVLSFDAVHYDTRYRNASNANRRHVLTPERLSSGSIFISPPVSISSRNDPFHLGLQWSLYGTDPVEDGIQVSSRARLATARSDSLRALDASGESLEVSDVKILLAQGDGASLENAVPYPFSTIGPDTPLLIYFELYHLTFDDDDRTRYTVAYEVEGRRQRGWTRLFRGDATQRTSTEAEYRGTSRETDELIYLDVAELQQEETQDVRVTVRVTDEVTGESVERTATFEMLGTDARPQPADGEAN
jgi:GWxTD domain-containing protein